MTQAKERTVTLGIDLGNSETKSRNTSFPSGFNSFDMLPFGETSYLLKNGKYLIPRYENFVYEADKTLDKKWGDLVLISISREILHKLRNSEDVAGEIKKIKQVNLALGLPPAHMQRYKDKTLAFFKDYFSERVSYIYNGYDFSFSVGTIDIYPQDVAAMLVYVDPKTKEVISRKHKICYGLDIGGYTFDIVKTIDGRGVPDSYDSLNYGVNVLFGRIQAMLRKRFADNVEQIMIEDVLNERETFLPGDEIEAIKEETSAFVNEALNTIESMGIKLSRYYVIFLGGGSQLLKKYIVATEKLGAYCFISNTRINAEGYEKLLKARLKNS